MSIMNYELYLIPGPSPEGEGCVSLSK